VNETKSEVSVATVTTSPNSRKNRPTEPGRNEIGKNTTTSTSVMTIAATPISAPALIAAVLGTSPPREVALDVLEDDDRIVDEDSDDQRHREQRDRVEREVRELHREQRDQSDAGIAIITTIALRHERRKNSITMPVKTIARSACGRRPRAAARCRSTGR
jgi:type IV secretory pathway VirB10-like protein